MTQINLFSDEHEAPRQPVTPSQARLVLSRHKKVKATVTEGESFPLYDHEENRVRMFETVKAANDYLRRRHDALSELGYKKKWGTLLRGAFVFEKPDGSEVGLILEKRPKGVK